MRLRALFAGALLLAPALQVLAAPVPFLWQIEGGKTTHYLIGSIHMLPEAAYPLPAELEAAYAATRSLVLEADLDALQSPETQGRLLGAAIDDRPGGLKASVGEKLYRKLQARASDLGAPAPICDSFRAWFCSLTLEMFTLQRAGFAPEFGIDQHFFTKARDDGRPVIGLETAEDQAALFIGMPEAMSIGMLAATLEELTSDSQNPAELLRLWRENDLQAVEKMSKDLHRQYPAIYARMLADRNRNWLPKLAGLLSADSPQLVIVGAAHLSGPDGLLALMKSRGLIARPVTGPITAPPAVEK